MEIRQLDKASFAGKRFIARYLTRGYYDIRPSETGFSIQYAPFDTTVERSFEDVFFGEWLGEPVAYGAFEDGNALRDELNRVAKMFAIARGEGVLNEEIGNICTRQGRNG